VNLSTVLRVVIEDVILPAEVSLILMLVPSPPPSSSSLPTLPSAPSPPSLPLPFRPTGAENVTHALAPVIRLPQGWSAPVVVSVVLNAFFLSCGCLYMLRRHARQMERAKTTNLPRASVDAARHSDLAGDQQSDTNKNQSEFEAVTRPPVHEVSQEHERDAGRSAESADEHRDVANLQADCAAEINKAERELIAARLQLARVAREHQAEEDGLREEMHQLLEDAELIHFELEMELSQAFGKENAEKMLVVLEGSERDELRSNGGSALTERPGRAFKRRQAPERRQDRFGGLAQVFGSGNAEKMLAVCDEEDPPTRRIGHVSQLTNEGSRWHDRVIACRLALEASRKRYADCRRQWEDELACEQSSVAVLAAELSAVDQELALERGRWDGHARADLSALHAKISIVQNRRISHAQQQWGSRRTQAKEELRRAHATRATQIPQWALAQVTAREEIEALEALSKSLSDCIDEITFQNEHSPSGGATVDVASADGRCCSSELSGLRARVQQTAERRRAKSACPPRGPISAKLPQPKGLPAPGCFSVLPSKLPRPQGLPAPRGK